MTNLPLITTSNLWHWCCRGLRKNLEQIGNNLSGILAPWPFQSIRNVSETLVESFKQAMVFPLTGLDLVSIKVMGEAFMILGILARKFAVLVALAVLFFGSSVYAQQTATWSRTVGNFCLQGIPLTARKVEQAELNNGVIVEQFKVDFSSSNPPTNVIMRVFRTPPNAVSPLTRCSDLDGEVILEGRIKKLTIRGARETGQGSGPAFFEVGGIPGSVIEVELTKVKSTLAPLYGGMLQLGASGSIAPSSLAWVRNVGRISASTGTVGSGALDIETWGRELRGARLQLPGSNETVKTDLSAGNTNITLRVAVDGTSTELLRGTLTSGHLKLVGSALKLPASNFTDFDGSADALSVAASDAAVELRLANVRYRAKQGVIGSEATQAEGEKFNGTIASITSPGLRSGDVIEMRNQLVTNHVASAERCSWIHRGIPLTNARTCKASVASADASSIVSNFRTVEATSLMAGEALVPRGEVTWNLNSSAGVDELTGVVASADSRLGNLLLTGEAVRFEQPVGSGSELKIPFSLTVGPTQGNWQFTNGEGQATISGQLDELALTGGIVIPLQDPTAWYIKVRQNDLRFRGALSGEMRAHIYDGAPLLAVGTKLGFRSASPLRIAADALSGDIETSISAFALSNIDIKMGKEAANLVLTGPIQFAGDTILNYNLADGRAEIVEGKLEIQNIHLISEPGKPGDLGTVRVQNADFQVDSIAARFEDGAGGFLIKGVRVDAGQLEQVPGIGADQLRWSGALAAPLVIETISARIVRGEKDALLLEDEVVTNLKLDLINPTLGQGQQLRFSGKRMQLDFSEVSRSDVIGNLELSDAKITQTDDGAEYEIKDLYLTLNITGGPFARPNGNGTLRTGAVAVNIDINPELKFGGDLTRCNGIPEYRILPLNVRFNTDAVDLKMSMNDGEFRASGSASVSDAYVKERGQYECRKRVVAFRIVKEVRAKYKYPCPTWSKPLKMCRGWTTIVPELRADVDRLFRIRHVRAAGMWKSVSFRIFPEEGKTKFERCLKVGLYKPVIDASYFFTPKTNVAIADSIFQELMDLHSRPFMSGITSGFTDILGNSLAQTKNGFCI